MANMRDPRSQRSEDDYNRDRKGHDHDKPDRPPKGEDNCGDGPSPTDKTIRRERNKVCSILKDKAGEVRQWEQSREGAHQLYNDKKCLFIRTETNWQYYRNIEISVGIELLQVNEGIKENVTSYKKWNDDLAAILKELVKATKEAKGKVAELKEAACKLNTCINDSCQSTQRKILTGESYDDCKENDAEVNDKCNAKEVLEHLEKIPNILLHDSDIIFNSATRVAGIQVFSNEATLEPLQKTLQEKSKAFDDFIVEKMKKGGEDLKKTQEELTILIRELTKATTGLYFRRADFKGIQRATIELCNCHCNCIQKNEPEGRLDQCKCDICEICELVKAGVCNVEDNPACRPPKEEQDQKQTLTY